MDPPPDTWILNWSGWAASALSTTHVADAGSPGCRSACACRNGPTSWNGNSCQPDSARSRWNSSLGFLRPFPLRGRERARPPRRLPFANRVEQQRRVRVLAERLERRRHREARAVAGRARQHPLHLGQARRRRQPVPPEHVRHEVAVEQRLVLDAVLLHALAEPAVPRLAPVAVRVDVPVVRRRGARAVDDGVVEVVVEDLDEAVLRVVALARREAPLAAVEVELADAGLVEPLRQVPRDLVLEIDRREEHLVGMVHELADGGARAVRRGRGAERAALAAERASTARRSTRRGTGSAPGRSRPCAASSPSRWRSRRARPRGSRVAAASMSAASGLDPVRASRGSGTGDT